MRRNDYHKTGGIFLFAILESLNIYRYRAILMNFNILSNNTNCYCYCCCFLYKHTLLLICSHTEQQNKNKHSFAEFKITRENKTNKRIHTERFMQQSYLNRCIGI